MTDNERLFRIIWPERCWHKGWKGKYSRKTCPKCGKVVYKIPRNPRFSHSDEIAQAMMEAGMWGEFVTYNENACIIDESHEYAREEYPVLWGDVLAEILVTPELLKRAIIAWREGK